MVFSSCSPIKILFYDFLLVNNYILEVLFLMEFLEGLFLLGFLEGLFRKGLLQGLF